MTFIQRSPTYAGASPVIERLRPYLTADEVRRILAEAGSSRQQINLNNVTAFSRACDLAAFNGLSLRSETPVPKRILQYWDRRDIPPDVATCMATWRIPGFEYVLFDEEQAREFLKTDFDHRHLEAYDLCNHPAMKSDLFRMAYLHRYGGIFVDSDDSYRGAGLENLVQDGLFRLRTIGWRELPAQSAVPTQLVPVASDRTAFNNNPIFCMAGDEILLKALDRATGILRALGPQRIYHQFVKFTGPTNLSLAVYATALDCIVNGREFYFSPIIGWDDIAAKNTELAYQKTDRNWRVYIRS
ncbi:MAG TPA: glycosyltransferase [Rhizomicrobium sp.]|nr:glycosyltransferase [Rhizomicrobium sp.]